MPGLVSEGSAPGLSSAPLSLAPAAGPLRFTFEPGGDELISQLALVLGALCETPLSISGLARSATLVRTRQLLAELGAHISDSDADTTEVCTPAGKLRSPDRRLDCGDSATTFMLLAGLIAGRKLSAELQCSSLQISGALPDLLAPLSEMGAEIQAVEADAPLPLRIRGCPLRPVQVRARWELAAHKAMLLIAGLGTVGECQVLEPQSGFDHIERLLRFLGADISQSGNVIHLKGETALRPAKLRIPGDYAPVAPLLVAGMLVPGSEIVVTMVGANPARFGMVRKLSRLGARIERQRDWQFGTEPVTSLRLTPPRRLAAFNVPPNLTQTLLDELPLLALIATQAHGASHLRGAEGLARRLPNELALAIQVLREFGADVEAETTGMTLNGPSALYGATLHCAGSRAIAMLASAAALIARGPSLLHGIGDLRDVYPDFVALVEGQGA